MSSLELGLFSQGVLRIHVVEAKDLMKKDISVLGKGKSDPYAIVSVGAQQFRTQTIDNTVNPKWDYWCEVSSLAKAIPFSVSRFFSTNIASKNPTGCPGHILTHLHIN